jgi:hypothetical protein
VQKNWFTPIQNFLIKINSTLKTGKRWSPSLLRENDVVIMDEVEKLNLPIHRAKTFNNWRLYSNVSTIANIITCEVTTIKSQYFKKNQVSMYKSESMQLWPNQKQPAIDTFHV